MRLLSLRLRNFKGIRDFTLDARGRDVGIYADNAGGKTTIFDAWSWLLFGKDSQNRADFEILPLGPDGKRLTEIAEAEVEAVVSTDPEDLGLDPVTIKRIYVEKRGQRGQQRGKMLGHETAYFINSVPLKEKDYKLRIAGLMDEGTFRMLTNPRHFNDHLPWQERRRILLDVCGDVPDSDVMASDPALAELPGILGKHTADECREIAKGKRADLNKRLAEIPTRIDEAQRAMPAEVQAPAQLAQLRKLRTDKVADRDSMKASGGVAEKTRELREVEGEILRLENAHTARIAGERVEVQRKIGELQALLGKDLAELAASQSANKEGWDLIQTWEKSLNALGEQYRECATTPFTYPSDSVCPTCRRPLPEEYTSEARATALAAWNVNKSQELARLTEAGRQLKSRINEQKRRNSDLETEAYKIDTRISVTRAGIQVHQEEVAKLDQAALARPATPEYIALTKRKRQIEDAVTILQAGGKADTSEIDAQIANLDKQIAAVEAALAQIKQRQQLLARIEQLRAEQRTLAAQLEQVEKVLYLLDAFTRAKVAMLDSRINSRFSMARFKLFEQLVNGGVEPCCETLYQGVPWGGGLNNGAQIAVGLDIISTLAAHYKVSAPVWIDNREGALHLPKIAAQTISLYVSGPDKTLRVVQA
jgi:hypothetical protein